MVCILPRLSRNLLFQLVAGCIAFSVSVEAIALTLGEALISETPQVNTLVARLPKRTYQLPLEALTEADYRRLVTELKILAAELSSGKQTLSKEENAELMKRLDVLSTRVVLLSNARITGRCAELSIDPVSAVAGRGDWATTKTSQGAPIERGSFEHFHLSLYFRLGCSGKQDFEVTRKVLEDISATPYDYKKTKAGLRSDVRHCELARWARYGIGGKRSETLALEYENRFRSEAWMIPVNPTAEDLRDLAMRHPGNAAAAYGFLCPPDRVTGGIDPRNPWKDLK